MASVTRLADLPIEHEVMEPRISGDSIFYSEQTVTSCAWRCDGCGRIWAKKWYAETCGDRNHRSSFDQVYHYKCEGYTTTGRTAEARYTRWSLGRDKRVTA